MNNQWTSLARIARIVALGASLVACAKPPSSIPLDEYAKALVGRWEGTIGNEKEVMSVKADGRFVCELQRNGFLAKTLSQSKPGTIRGTWGVSGKIVTLSVDGVHDERLRNDYASSVIVAFQEDKVVLKSDRGEVSSFHRISDD